MKEDWPILVSFFPDKWQELAVATHAIKGLRKEKEAEKYLRTLLLHLGCGYSMRETVTRAKLAGFADISDVAFLGRLRKANAWLHSLCVSLFAERNYSGTSGWGKSFRQGRLIYQRFRDGLQEVQALFARRGQVASNPSKALCPSQGAEAPGYFLAHFDHTDILLGLVIGEGHAPIMQEGEDPGLMLIQAVQQILCFGLFQSPAFGR